MRILHIIYDDVRNPWCGGGGALRTSTINAHLASHNEIVVLTGNFPGARNERIYGVDYVRVGFSRSYILSRISFTFLIPFVIRSYSSDIVINDCSFFAPCFADLYTRRPVVNIIHHLMGRHAIKLNPFLGFFPFLSERMFLKLAKNVITPTKSIKEIIRRTDRKRRVIDIPNGISPELFGLRTEEENYVLFIGRIDVYMKGLDLLIRAFAKMESKDVSLKIAGGGKRADLNRLRKMINYFGLRGRVEFLGRVSEEEKFDLLRHCLFLVMPSRFEGWGITAVEANAAGKMVLGTKIRALSEAVIHDRTAVLIDPEHVKQLSLSLDNLVRDKEKRLLYGRQGRDWARRFSWESISEEQYDFYKSCLMP